MGDEDASQAVESLTSSQLQHVKALLSSLSCLSHSVPLPPPLFRLLHSSPPPKATHPSPAPAPPLPLLDTTPLPAALHHLQQAVPDNFLPHALSDTAL